MIDALYARYGKRREKPPDPNYKPQDAIRSKKLINPHTDKLAVIFPGWHTHNFPINILAKRVARRGWSVLVYDFHDQILEPDEEIVAESFRIIRDTVSQEIQDLVSKKGYRHVHFISVSMGGVPMALVCDKFSHFDSVTAVVGGDNLAIDMWYGLRTAHYRVAFQKMHVGVRRLAKDWDTLAPANHLRHFKGKPIKFIISLHDNFVGTKYQQRLARQLLEAGAQVKIRRRYAGHTLTILRFCLFDNPI